MKYYYVLPLIFCLSLFAQCEEDEKALFPANSITFSQNFLLAIKMEEPFQLYLDTLEQIDLDLLESSLDNNNKKLTFWINTYNSLVQVAIKNNKDQYTDQDAFFNDRNLLIGNTKISLNDIENGILRRLPSDNKDFVDRFKVSKLDYRIHFTLNCGATSCPPIAFYSDDKIEEQLTLAEESFILTSSSFDANKNILAISELFDWYEDDFGGKNNVLELMKKHKIINENDSPIVKYTPYNWDLEPDNY